ncbi:MAG: pectate lyase [Bacteroidales bacterium]
MKKLFLILIVVVFNTLFSWSQESSQDFSRWKDIISDAPDQWYGSDRSKEVASNILFAQTEWGGWPKNIEYAQPMSKEYKIDLKSEFKSSDHAPNIDNGATIQEMTFLAKMFSATNDSIYLKAWNKGFEYLVEAQYDNGGWPQFYPLRKGYSRHITYNDNAMINVMDLMYDVMRKSEDFTFATDEQAKIAKLSFDLGVQCLINTQIVINGVPTVWCAQHDEQTLLPAKARAYELPSLSGAESVGIIRMLMKVKKPSPEVIRSIESAVKWLNDHKINGFSQQWVRGEDGVRRRTLVADSQAKPLWARFYDLDTQKPFFCDRDGVKVDSIEKLGLERRNGYSWYTDKPFELLNSVYPKWRAKNVLR